MWTHVETVTQSHDHTVSRGLNVPQFSVRKLRVCCGLTIVNLALLTLCEVALLCFLKLHFSYVRTCLTFFWCMLFLKHYGAPHDGSALVSVSCLSVIGGEVVVANNQKRRMMIWCLTFKFHILSAVPLCEKVSLLGGGGKCLIVVPLPFGTWNSENRKRKIKANIQ